MDEDIAAQQVKANIAVLEKIRERLYQGFFVPVGDIFGPFVFGYILIGLAAEHYEADLKPMPLPCTSKRIRRRTAVGLPARR